MNTLFMVNIGCGIMNLVFYFEDKKMINMGLFLFSLAAAGLVWK